MKIKIGDPYIIGHNLSKEETKKVAQVLENSGWFKLALKKIRDKYGIPHTGFNYKNKSQKLTANKLDDNADFIDDVFELTQTLNPPLPKYWTFSLIYFVLENILRPPQHPEIGTYPSKYFKPSNKKNPLGLFLLLNYFFIMIGENISKEQLHDFIDEEWDQIKEYTSKLPKNPTNKMPRFDLGLKIVEMKENDDLTFDQIAEKLSEKVSEDNMKEYDALNGNNVKQIYNRTKAKLIRINRIPRSS